MVASSIHGEFPPFPPKDFFGRNELIEEIISLTENFKSVALIGAGGIGKTSIAFTALHNDCIKKWCQGCEACLLFSPLEER